MTTPTIPQIHALDDAIDGLIRRRNELAQDFFDRMGAGVAAAIKSGTIKAEDAPNFEGVRAYRSCSMECRKC